MGINDVIPYDWKLGWDSGGMSSPKPKVNNLLKAIIEGDVKQMHSLFGQGATLKGIDKQTFERALYHVLDDYGTVKCLVDHGFTALYGDFQYYKCYGPDCYPWGLAARAWFLQAYDVMELLAGQGFEELNFCIGGKKYGCRQLIFQKNDVRAIRILLENGYLRDMLFREMNAYPDSKVTLFMQEHPFIKRKSAALDNGKYHTIPKPELEKEGLFNRKKIQARNQLLMLDYQDRVNAQKRMLDSFTSEELKMIQNDLDLGKLTEDAMKTVLNLK